MIYYINMSMSSVASSSRSQYDIIRVLFYVPNCGRLNRSLVLKQWGTLNWAIISILPANHFSLSSNSSFISLFPYHLFACFIIISKNYCLWFFLLSFVGHGAVSHHSVHILLHFWVFKLTFLSFICLSLLLFYYIE